MEKVRQTIYIDNEVYFYIYQYIKENGLKTISEAVNVMINKTNWRSEVNLFPVWEEFVF